MNEEKKDEVLEEAAEAAAEPVETKIDKPIITEEEAEERFGGAVEVVEGRVGKMNVRVTRRIQEKKERIWELDFFRGVCILGVVIVHTVFDLRYFAGLSFGLHPLFQFIMDYGGILFVILSGLCATFSSNSARRGVLVFGCGLIIYAVTDTMISMDLADASVRIQFGVLHLLGVCMILYAGYKKLPTWAIFLLGVGIVVLGYWFRTFTVETKWLFPLGLCAPDFAAGDYFPLCPHLGWFMLGTVLGRTAYKERRTLLPKVPTDNRPVRFFCGCGKASLWIYLLHQPIVYGLLMLYERFFG